MCFSPLLLHQSQLILLLQWSSLTHTLLPGSTPHRIPVLQQQNRGSKYGIYKPNVYTCSHLDSSPMIRYQAIDSLLTMDLSLVGSIGGATIPELWNQSICLSKCWNSSKEDRASREFKGDPGELVKINTDAAFKWHRN